MRQQNCFSVAELLYVSGGDQVRCQLGNEVKGNEKRDFFQGNPVSLAERQEKKRSQIDDDRLGDIADEASGNGVFMREFGHGRYCLSEVLNTLYHNWEKKSIAWAYNPQAAKVAFKINFCLAESFRRKKSMESASK